MDKMISYWQDYREICSDDEGQVVIIGMYDHYNEGNPQLSVGIHWGDYPKSRGILSPLVLSEKNAKALLAGLLHQSIQGNYKKDNKEDNKEAMTKIIEALEKLENK